MTESGAATSDHFLDPRLRAAALCDTLTDYEIQLIRKALGKNKGRSGRPAKAPSTSPRPSTAATSPKPAPSSPKPKKTTVLVQKTLTNWAVKVDNKNDGESVLGAYPAFKCSGAHT